MELLLDTHVLLWWQAGGQLLSARAARELSRADTVLISPITCWEVATLVARGRVRLDRDVFDWVRDVFSQERIELAPLSAQAAVGAARLTEAGFHGDPVDRFLYATARQRVVPFVTKDARIRSFARAQRDVRAIW